MQLQQCKTFLPASLPRVNSTLEPCHLVKLSLNRRYSWRPVLAKAGTDQTPKLETGSDKSTSRRRVLLGGASLALFPFLAPETHVPRAIADEDIRIAYFSGGNFIFMEYAFDQIGYKGVKKTTTGYIDGVQTVAVEYNASKLRYRNLLATYWKSINPTEANAQFGDKGPQFQTVIWVEDEEQTSSAEEEKAKLGRSGVFRQGEGKPLLTEVRQLGDLTFTPARDEDQDFAKKNPTQFKFISGKRKAYKEDLWGAKTNCKGTVCGYVTFGCRDECLDIFAEYRSSE